MADVAVKLLWNSRTVQINIQGNDGAAVASYNTHIWNTPLIRY